ncbi:MAG: SAP domain-containing protein, partial [Lachnospiraceae bacterium]|nr:SAP domain-containing protein [Lachnospiraceae bacterium]
NDSGEDIEYGMTHLLVMHKKAAPFPDPSSYALFFYSDRECGLTNPSALHRQLLADGYLKPASIQEQLEVMTVPELKQILASIGAKVSGKKADLIQRISTQADPDVLKAHLGAGKKLYSLTDKGRDFLQSHEDYIRFHQYARYGFTLADYKLAKAQHPNEDCEHTLLSMCGSSQSNIRSVLYDGINDHSNAMQEFLTGLYMRINRVTDFEQLKKDMQYKKYRDAARDIWDCASLTHVVVPNDATYLTRHAAYYNRNMLDDIFKNHPVSNTLLSLQEFSEMLEEMQNAVVFDYEKWNNLINSRFQQILKV